MDSSSIWRLFVPLPSLHSCVLVPAVGPGWPACSSAGRWGGGTGRFSGRRGVRATRSQAHRPRLPLPRPPPPSAPLASGLGPACIFHVLLLEILFHLFFLPFHMLAVSCAVSGRRKLWPCLGSSSWGSCAETDCPHRCLSFQHERRARRGGRVVLLPLHSAFVKGKRCF